MLQPSTRVSSVLDIADAPEQEQEPEQTPQGLSAEQMAIVKEAQELAVRLFDLDGYSRSQVAAQLSPEYGLHRCAKTLFPLSLFVRTQRATEQHCAHGIHEAL